MTILRPSLTPAELQDARDAWALVQLGQPVPTQYRPAAMKAAAYCFARGYDHDDAAGARPLFIHPDGGREGHPGVAGVNRTWTPAELGAWVAKAAAGIRPKGTGPMLSPGHSKVGDEGPGLTRPPLQRGDERCRNIGWLALDADGAGEWDATLNALGCHGAAHVRFRSSNHCTLPGCERHPGGASKWHLMVPLREAWAPTGGVNGARAEWKGELYAAARFAFHLVGEMAGRGFDRQLDQFLCRMYAGAPTDPAHARLPREVAAVEGIGFDIRACFAGMEELGLVDPAPVRAARAAAEAKTLGAPWRESDGEPPMVAAFKAAGLYMRPTAAGNHTVVCPWQATHTTGRAGDSSTILFANGKFHCSHSHLEGSAAGGIGMREVLAMLPPEARAVHAAAQAARPVRPSPASPSSPSSPARPPSATPATAPATRSTRSASKGTPVTTDDASTGARFDDPDDFAAWERGQDQMADELRARRAAARAALLAGDTEAAAQFARRGPTSARAVLECDAPAVTEALAALAAGEEVLAQAEALAALDALIGEGAIDTTDALAPAPAPSAPAGDAFAMLLAAMEVNPEGVLADAFVRRAAALSTAEKAQIHTKIKTAGAVPLRAYNRAISDAEKALRAAADRAESEARIEKAALRKPKVHLGPDEDRVADEAVAALGAHPNLYQRGGALVYVLRDMSPLSGVTRPRGCPRIATLPNPTLREYLAASAVWVQSGGEDGPRRAHVPPSVVNAVGARGEWRGIRALEAVVECPMLRPDGTVITEPGFDAATGLLYVPGEAYPAIPEHPTQDDARAAAAMLLDLVVDFPFKTPAHRAGWLASVLTCLARFAFRGPSPLFMVDANTAGAGKGKVTGLVGEIVSGRPMATMAPVEDDAEQRKRITALAIGGDNLVLIDNVVGSLGGPSLDVAMTSTEWSDRVLGSSVTVKVPLAITWFATGNNIQLIGDMARRVLHIRLESPLDHPEDRVAFKHADLEAHVRANRPALVAAALTILRAFCVAGRPAQGLASWGSFEGWSTLVRGAVVFAGEPDPAATRQEVRSEADVAAQSLRDLVEGWPALARRFGGQCTASQALTEIARDARQSENGGEASLYEGLRGALAELIPTQPGKLPSTRQLGYTLRAFKGRAIMCSDGKLRTLTISKENKHGMMWVVRSMEGGATDPGRATEQHVQGGDGGYGGHLPTLPARSGENFTDPNIDPPHVSRGWGCPPSPLSPPDPSADGADAPDDFGPQWAEVDL